jgi:steroid 5-alpha reductase family enzyme
VISSHLFLTGLAVTGGADLALFLLTFLVARIVRRWNVVDITWGLSFVVAAAASFAWSTQLHHGDTARRVLVLVLTCLWGLRLSAFIGWRSRGKGEDPRYHDIMARGTGSRTVRALTVVFLPQAVLSWLVSMPVQMAMYLRPPAGPLAWVGTAVWGLGLFFEAAGDAQMSAFRSDPANKGQVMDRGLWHYTRHPNYFGDATVWTGLFLIAAGRWPGVLTFFSPLVMLYFLYFKSGKGLLEKSMADSRPGYREYMQRTSGFLPLPPRRRA